MPQSPWTAEAAWAKVLNTKHGAQRQEGDDGAPLETGLFIVQTYCCLPTPNRGDKRSSSALRKRAFELLRRYRTIKMRLSMRLCMEANGAGHRR